jgi:hypothetical protein
VQLATRCPGSNKIPCVLPCSVGRCVSSRPHDSIELVVLVTVVVSTTSFNEHRKIYITHPIDTSIAPKLVSRKEWISYI